MEKEVLLLDTFLSYHLCKQTVRVWRSRSQVMSPSQLRQPPCRGVRLFFKHFLPSIGKKENLTSPGKREIAGPTPFLVGRGRYLSQGLIFFKLISSFERTSYFGFFLFLFPICSILLGGSIHRKLVPLLTRRPCRRIFHFLRFVPFSSFGIFDWILFLFPLLCNSYINQIQENKNPFWNAF